MTEVKFLTVCFFQFSLALFERRSDALVKTKPNQEDKEKILCTKVPCLHGKYIRTFCVLVPPSSFYRVLCVSVALGQSE